VVYNNYWKLRLKELPSKGVFYNKYATIKIKTLTLKDIKYLATINKDNATFIIDEILESSLILKNLEFGNICLPDRMYMVFWLRVNSYINSGGYNLTLKKCDCGEEEKKDIALTDFDLVYFNINKERKFVLPNSGYTMEFCVPTIKYKDDIYNTWGDIKDKEILDMMLWCNFKNEEETISNKYDLLNELDAMDYIYIKSYLDDFMFGFSNKLDVYCDKCNRKTTYEFEINDYGMFGAISMFDIMKNIMYISEVCGYQVKEYHSWVEIELMFENAKRIVEERNENLEKTQGSMNKFKR